MIAELLANGLVDAGIYLSIGFLVGAIATGLMAQGSFDRGFASGISVGRIDRIVDREDQRK